MKMTYPGLVLLVGVGVGIATFLYYVFTESNRENGQQLQYSRNRRSSDRYDDWTMASHRSENTLLNRRSSSHFLRTKEEKDFSNKDDVNNCSICQYALIESEVTEVQPCKHNFHKACIDELKKFDPTAVCPNCRTVMSKHAI
ncbi:uncharacterized protein [Linepithema humile]|uniref:uncharacterized protein n=1 Tax=Linepithema humile TaxID=83485 RepID=UPI000623A696|nr:PREDICTED: E3 ubiquitin-protein ligase ZNRF3-like [Linepithema humile]